MKKPNNTSKLPISTRTTAPAPYSAEYERLCVSQGIAELDAGMDIAHEDVVRRGRAIIEKAALSHVRQSQ